MAATPSRLIRSQCLQIRVYIWHILLSEFSHRWVPGVGITALLNSCFAGRPGQGRNNTPQAILMSSFRAQDAVRSGVKGGISKHITVAARTNLADFQESPIRPPFFAITGWAARANGHFPVALPATTCRGCPGTAKTSKRGWCYAPTPDSFGIGHRTNF